MVATIRTIFMVVIAILTIMLRLNRGKTIYNSTIVHDVKSPVPEISSHGAIRPHF